MSNGGLFPEWYAEQLAKQAEHPETHTTLPQRIRTMRTRYGHRDDQTCAQCKHLYSKEMYSGRRTHRWYKCAKFGQDTNGAGTDWRVSWPACGAFEAKTDEPKEAHV